MEVRKDSCKEESSTQNQRFNQFAVVLNDAVDNELIASAPSKGVKAPDKGKEEMVYLTLDEIYQMRDWEKRDTVKPMLYRGFLFACFTGLRGGDISTIFINTICIFFLSPLLFIFIINRLYIHS